MNSCRQSQQPTNRIADIGRTSWATLCACRFERTGSMDDLEQAIKLQEEAVAVTQPNKHSELAMYLNNLGLSLQDRFERTGSIKDLDRAVTVAEQAALATPGI